MGLFLFPWGLRKQHFTRHLGSGTVKSSLVRIPKTIRGVERLVFVGTQEVSSKIVKAATQEVEQ